MLPTFEWTGELYISELASLDVIEVLKHPADAERAETHTQNAAVTVVDPGSALLHFERLPRGRQSFERARLGVPSKEFIGGHRYS
jgi:hypothetical protein